MCCTAKCRTRWLGLPNDPTVPNGCPARTESPTETRMLESSGQYHVNQVSLFHSCFITTKFPLLALKAKTFATDPLLAARTVHGLATVFPCSSTPTRSIPVGIPVSKSTLPEESCCCSIGLIRGVSS